MTSFIEVRPAPRALVHIPALSIFWIHEASDCTCKYPRYHLSEIGTFANFAFCDSSSGGVVES